MKEAVLYETKSGECVRCLLCAHNCLIPNNKKGRCNVRINLNGKLFSLNYFALVANAADPIEKKPLYHFLPSSKTYSIACLGCNFNCAFCQNYGISQINSTAFLPDINADVDSIIENALTSGCKSIAYTYSEPTVFMETVLDVASYAHDNGLYNVFISNGFFSENAIKLFLPYIDAFNIDLKSIRSEFYTKYCCADVDIVKRNIRILYESNIWLELTTLIIPDVNDSDDEIRKIIDFILSVSPDIPLHISAFYPKYKMLEQSPAKTEKLIAIRELALCSGLRYVYLGNVSCDNNTYCRKCGNILIRRNYYDVIDYSNNGQCKKCGDLISGFFS